jgi:hypothetical protein
MMPLLMSCDRSEGVFETQENEQLETYTSTILENQIENDEEYTETSEPPSEPFSGRIAIITNESVSNIEVFSGTETLRLKYGEERVIHRVWPAMFAREGEMMISIMQELASDPELRAVVINQAVINTNAAVDAFLKLRDDVFIVYVSPGEDASDVALRADLILDINTPALGNAFVQQAELMGTQTIVHYSFPRHMNTPQHAERRDSMRDEAERLGIEFIEVEAPDPMGDGRVTATQQFVSQDVPYQVERFGTDTAFFGTNCAMLLPMIAQVLATGAIFVQPCHPSPFHVYPGALGIETFIPSGDYDEWGVEIMRLVSARELISAMRDAAYTQEATGRLATMPMTSGVLWTAMGVEYTIRWINGEVDRYAIDLDVLAEIGREIILQESGEEVEVTLEVLEVDGRIYPNFILGLMGDIIL